MVTLSQPTIINSFNDAYDFMSIQQYPDIPNNCDNANLNFYFTQNQQGTSQKNWSERVLHDITGLLYVLSPFGKILYCSESSLQLIGYQSNELVGRLLTDFLHVDDLNLFTNNFQYALNSMSRVKVHYRIKCKDNSYILLETIGQTKQDASGYSFLAISQPYISRSNGLLDSFLEIKMENEVLKKRLNELMSLQANNDDNSINYFSPMSSSSRFTASPTTTSPHLDFFSVQQQPHRPADPPAFYPIITTTSSPIQNTNKPSRRQSTCNGSTLFYFNTPIDETFHTNPCFSNKNTPSIASSTDYNDLISKAQGDGFFPQGDNLLQASAYVSSCNSPTGEQKDKWKKRVNRLCLYRHSQFFD